MSSGGNFGVSSKALRRQSYPFENVERRFQPEHSTILVYLESSSENPAGEPDSGGTLIQRQATTGSNDGGAAVVIRNGEKSFQTGCPVLFGLNMTVPCGSIYALLGESGCGKTTLLSCIVGLKNLNRGYIRVYGAKPGSKGVGVPGPNVGYMPQETCLYMGFTIKETLRYFGTFAGMSNNQVNAKIEFLRSLLELPDVTKRISSLSGGQRRRVSFAVALIHDPELLILDEPTVGVDVLLRDKIWSYLQDLVSSKRTTVIITTHYLEEARKADIIGILRRGRLLAENPPSELLSQHGESSLEKAVLQLCMKDGNAPISTSEAKTTRDIETNSQYPKVKMASVLRKPKTAWNKSLTHIKALARKNLMTLSRNLILLLFVISIVPVQYIILSQTTRDDPVLLQFGYVNNEFANSSTTRCLGNATQVVGECNVKQLSCRFLSYIYTNKLDLEEFETEVDAKAAVQNGTIRGYLLLPQKFSTGFWKRPESLGDTIFDDDDTIFNSSQIIVKLDQTNKLITLAVAKIFHNAISDFLLDCGFDPRQGEFALQYKTPILGKSDTDFQEFLAPGGIQFLVSFFAINAASIHVLREKKSGMLERTIVAGVSMWEIMVAYSISEFLVIVIQALLSFTVLILIYNVTPLGSPVLLLILWILAGYVGISLGFLLGTICTEEIHAVMIGIAAFFPNYLLSGVAWPLEGMPLPLQYISQILPSTLAGEASRSITSRGWEFTHPHVWPGFVVQIAYIFGFYILTIFLHKLVKR